MAKDPAFLFYSSDFLTGTLTMPFEDRGKYITILSLMHQQGRMQEETIRFLVGSISDNLRSKFSLDEKGLWYNERLEIEIDKRTKFTDSRRLNGSKGGRKPIDNPSGKPNGLAKKNHTENEDVNINEDVSEAEFINPFGEKFLEMWGQWEIFKKKEFGFSYKSVQSEQSAVNKLVKLSNGKEEIAIAIIQESMANGWQGLFELKTSNNGTSKNATTVGKVTGAGLDEALAKRYSKSGSNTSFG
jgi:hypothetical protein